jgi:hypothetical protein
MPWARDMTTDAIREELIRLHTRIVDFESADDDYKEHGGSPGGGSLRAMGRIDRPAYEARCAISNRS